MKRTDFKRSGLAPSNACHKVILENEKNNDDNYVQIGSKKVKCAISVPLAEQVSN